MHNTTRRRDHGQKRQFYLELGVADYWIVDGDERMIRLIRLEHADLLCKESLIWRPEAATEPLVVDVRRVFRDALGS